MSGFSPCKLLQSLAKSQCISEGKELACCLWVIDIVLQINIMDLFKVCLSLWEEIFLEQSCSMEKCWECVKVLSPLCRGKFCVINELTLEHVITCYHPVLVLLLFCSLFTYSQHLQPYSSFQRFIYNLSSPSSFLSSSSALQSVPSHYMSIKRL